MDNDVLDAAYAIWSQRYSGAAVVFAAGSLVRGEGTAYSDLDLVVVYSALPCAYRESFTFQRLPVEAFVHDPETLEYCCVEMDRASGIPVYSSTSFYRGDLHRALLQALDGAPPECGRGIESVSDDPRRGKVTVSFVGGEVREFDFVIAADRAHSKIRR